MNEHFWNHEADPLALLDALHPMRTLGSAREQTRQSRMYLLACARRAWRRLPNVCRTLVALAEVYADAPRMQEELRADLAPIAEHLMHSDGEDDDLLEAETELAFLPLWNGVSLSDVLAQHQHREQNATPAPPAPPLTPEEWRGLSALVYLPFERNTPAFTWVPRNLHSRRLLREVYGLPYKQTHFSHSWRTDTVISLARGMYERREFSAMPILGDALEDAGCTDGDVLLHCRLAAEHVRGCWVLDLILDLK